MVNCECSRKYRYKWDYLFITIFLLLINEMTLCMRIGQSDSHHVAIDPAADCSASETCGRCCADDDRRRNCSWSVVLQACVARTVGDAAGDVLTVLDGAHCPRFAVVGKPAVAGESFRYTVRVSNDDANGSVTAYMRRVRITCCLETCEFAGTMVGDRIVCAETHTPSSYLAEGAPALTVYLYVLVDGRKLRFDDEAEYYFPIYDRERCAGVTGAELDEGCATCLWRENVNEKYYAHYLKWCPSGNRCTGAYQMYERRDASDHVQRFRPGMAAAEPLEVRVECASLRIRSWEPRRAPRTGGSVMRIAVDGHRMMAEDKTVTVTVAGRGCADPIVVDADTITCTVGPMEVAPGLPDGSVHVTYASTAIAYTLTSADAMSFVDPEVTTIQPACGPVGGGTLLTVRGAFLDAGVAARVSVVVAEDDDGTVVAVPCDTVSRSHHSIVCLTGGAVSAVRGRVRVEFDGGLRVYGGGFAYAAGHPTVASAGRPPSIEGIASGGTAVSIHGTGFGCLERAALGVHDGATERRHHGCRVINDSLIVCRAPRLDHVLSASDTSARLRFGIRAWDTAGREFDLVNGGRFVLYPDPVFADFVADGASLVINGPGRGYGAEDVAVRWWRDDSAATCVVTLVAWDRVVCAFGPRPPVSVRLESGIVVTVGDRFVRRVAARKSAHDRATLLSRVSGTVIVAFVTLSILIVSAVVVLLRLNAKKQYTLST